MNENTSVDGFSFAWAISKTWTRTLDPDPKNLDLEKHWKRLDMER